MSEITPMNHRLRRRGPLSSRTVDTLLHIFSLCSPPPSISDKPITIDVPLDCAVRIPNESHIQEQTSMDETQVVLDSQQDSSYNKNVVSAEHDQDMLGEKDLSQKVNANPSVNVDIKSHDSYDMICSSPHLPTNEGVEEGEISRGFMDIIPEIDTKSVAKTDSEPQDVIHTKTELKDASNTIPLLTKVENAGTDLARLVNKTRRSLVDYSEIAVHAKSQESSKPATLKTCATNLVAPEKDNDVQNNKKRQGSCIKEERRNKKSKKYVYPTTCPDNITLPDEHLEDASHEVVASANKDASNEKKNKRVLTKERKAKKKIKERIKRAEKNRKLGIKRLKLQPVVKERKITYCRHYMKGRCHEGEKCKFSHDTIPLTKFKPCCHFARHACMKGDDCPFDHQLSKYPCNNYQKGSCNRGSDCMFSHETQPSEDSLNESNKSKPEQKPLSVPNFVDITPKLTRPLKGMNFLIQEKPSLGSRPPPKGISFPLQEKLSLESRAPKGLSFLSQEKLQLEPRPPKGISFLSQEKLPLESCSSPKVDSEGKEMTRTPMLIQDSEDKSDMSPVVHDTEEITKAPTVVPRGINFLSFGKKPGLDCSKGGYSFRISKVVERSLLCDVVGDGLKHSSTADMVNEEKVERSTTDRRSSSKKPMPVMSFMSSSTSQKALWSTLAFACALDSGIKSKV